MEKVRNLLLVYRNNVETHLPAGRQVAMRLYKTFEIIYSPDLAYR